MKSESNIGQKRCHIKSESYIGRKRCHMTSRAKSFECVHSIKYSAGVAKPSWAKSFIITPTAPCSCQERDKYLFSFQFWICLVLLFYWINCIWPKLYLWLERKPFPPSDREKPLLLMVRRLLGFIESEQCIRRLLQKASQNHASAFVRTIISAVKYHGMPNHLQV